MSNEARIAEIEEQLALLPVGTLTYKKIKGKDQPYLQYRKDGKTVTKYLKLEERELILRQLVKRDALLRELEDLKTVYSQPTAYPLGHVYESNYRTNVIYGSALKAMLEAVKGYEKRDCYNTLVRYINGNYIGRVCLLYGLRRTGKTTLLLQAINDLAPEDFQKAAYIKATQSVTMADLNKDISTLQKIGFKYIFLDEITLVEDFIDSAALFSDIYATMGMKLILSGTDSLGFWLTLRGELYDRAITIHTTYLPFREFSRLLKIDDIDEYIRYGGTLKVGELAFEDQDALADDASFRDNEATRRYIDTAICQNIQHSLNCCRDGMYFRHLQELYNEGELTGAINRIIEGMNHQFLLKLLIQRFKSHDLGSAAEILRKQKEPSQRTTILDEIDKDKITQHLMGLLQIRNQEDQRIGIKAIHVQEIKEYLRALDLVLDCPKETYFSDAEPMEYVLFTQPGMRYCQAQALVYVLMKDEIFINHSENEIKLACERILEDVAGRMLEDIVLLETVRTLPKNKKAFKLIMGRSEFDMVIYDYTTDTCELYEIKHSSQVSDNQYHVLADEEQCQLVEKKYGCIAKKCVLYRGEPLNLANGIQYENVETYLKVL